MFQYFCVTIFLFNNYDVAVSFPIRLKNGMLHLSVYVIKRDINLFRLYSEVFILLSDFLERRFIKKNVCWLFVVVYLICMFSSYLFWVVNKTLSSKERCFEFNHISNYKRNRWAQTLTKDLPILINTCINW